MFSILYNIRAEYRSVKQAEQARQHKPAVRPLKE